MVAHLIGKAAQIIESVWPSSHQSIHYSSKTPVMPLHVFVKETLRRSRTTLSTLQLALFYIYKVKAPVLALQRRQDVSQRALQPRLPPSPSVSWDERSDSGHMPHEYFEFTQPILSRTTLPPTPPYACNTPPSLSPVSRVTTTMGEPVAENAKHVGCGRRMFLAALILASKYQQDRSYSNKAWSKISGLPVAEINRNEIAFLALIEYRLFVSPSVFQKWVVVLTDTTHVTERPALSRSNSTPKMGSGALANRRYAMRRNSAQYDPLGHVGSNGLCPSALPSCIALSALDIPSELPGSATPTRLIPEQQRDAGSYMTQQWVETQRRELLQSRSCVPAVHPSVLSRATVVGKVDPLWGEGQTVMAQDRGCGVLPSPTSSLSSTGDVHCTKRRAEAEIAPARVKTRRLSVSFLVDPYLYCPPTMIRAGPSIPIPRTVPLLPLPEKVLLPGVVTRLQITRRDSLPLFEKILRSYDSRELSKCIIGVFPLRIPQDSASAPSSSPSATTPMATVPSTNGKSDTKDKPLGDLIIPGPSPVYPGGGPSEGQLVTRMTKSGRAGTKNEVNAAHIHLTGCAARLIRLERTVGGFTVVLEGLVRLRLNKILSQSPFFEADVTPMPDKAVDKADQELQDQIVTLRSISREFVSLLQTLKLPAPVLTQLQKFLDNVTLMPGQVVDLLMSTIESTVEEKITILDAVDLKDRIHKAVELLTRQIHVLKISQKVHDNVEGKLNKKQREFYLRQQMAAIKEELGEKDAGEEDEMSVIEQRLSAANLPSEVQKAADRELKRLRKMQPSSSEYSVIRNYLDWLADLPWAVSSEDVLDVEKARRQLNDDHHGLEKVKRRILEYLAVTKLQQLKGDVKGPILCLVGPPGVGKTSLGRSIATAMGRKFHRISLGGVWDESEIRGHRRTYVGALPGLIIHGLKKCEVNNPVFLLDEIDKVGSRGHHGDPSAAFLEVLDPEQNSTFTDHYLNVPFDLSRVLFIATANSLETIPGPLLDRMETITIPGYTYAEKLAIATNHLLPKQIRQHGLGETDVQVTQDALLKVATSYTRESGVRHLEREIGSLVRAKAVEYAEAQEKRLSQTEEMSSPAAAADDAIAEYQPLVTLSDVEDILGQEKFVNEVTERVPVAGVVTGMAYNGVGGGILFIEVSQMPGKGHLQLTGSLGDVIKESAQIALSWVKSHGYDIGLTNSPGQNIMEKADVHIHMPSGGTPKDGPSAGIAMVCALVSMFSNQTVPSTTAMTGEFTLRGLVMPVGGIKEKVIAAHRAGVRKIIMPLRNQKDVTSDVPANVREDIEFYYASTIGEVLREAFEGRLMVRSASTSASIVDSRL
ncbi:hypothetical protein BGZ75_004809 [Mortierella antarctica]|nr:hypothetical protein BGZ75_004809 [Mortierella antarctica]